VTCSARLAKLNRFESSQIAIPDARKVSPLWKWPTTAPRRKQSRNSMEKKSAGATSLSTKHGQCKKETSPTAVAAVAADDIETVEKRRLCPNYKKENLRQLQYCEPARKRVRCGLSLRIIGARQIYSPALQIVLGLRTKRTTCSSIVRSFPEPHGPKRFLHHNRKGMLFAPHLENGVLLRGPGHASYSATFLALHLAGLFPCIGVETHPLVSVKGFFCSVAPRRATLGNR
jgi:hypothetical protein